MAQLYYRYGAMNSGKSIEILKVAHNYEEQGKTVRLYTNAIDNRDGVGYVSSRVGLRREAYVISKHTDLYVDIMALPENEYPSCILIDEAQFLTRHQVKSLTMIVDYLDIPVIAFGLKNDFQNNLFEGSEQLLLHADKIEEMKTICWYCGKKATMNLRLVNGKPTYHGEQIQIGGNESYKPVCRRHYNNMDNSMDDKRKVVFNGRVHER